MRWKWTTARGIRASRVRYVVLAAMCVLALLTYVNRLGFGVAAPAIQRDLDLGDEQMGYLASAFLVAYALFQVPGGLLADRLGSRHLLTILVVGWSGLSAATTLGVLVPAGVWAFLLLVVLRFLFGLFQAAQFPALARILADWMPPHERASAQGFVWMFSRLGGAIVPFLFTGMLALFGTWTACFYVMSGLALVWCASFWPWFRATPREMARVNSAELSLIAAGRAPAPGPQPPVRWGVLVRSVDVWCLCLMYAFVGFGGNFFTNMLPLYLKTRRHLPDLEFATLSAVPLSAGIAGCALGGLVSDAIVRRWGSRKWGRRCNGAVGLMLAGLATLLIPHAHDLRLLGCLLGAAFFFTDLNMGPSWAACTDIGERYTGTVSGAMNMSGSLAGAVGTAVAGICFRRHLEELVFLSYGASYILGGLCWLGVDASRTLSARGPGSLPDTPHADICGPEPSPAASKEHTP